MQFLLLRKDMQTVVLCGLISGFVLLDCACVLIRVRSAWGFRDCVYSFSEKDFGPFADSLSSACCLLKSSASSALTIRQSVVQDKE